MKLIELDLKRKNGEKHENGNTTLVVHDMLPKFAARTDRKDESVVVNGAIVDRNGSMPKDHTVIAQLMEKVEDLVASKTAQNDKIVYLEKDIATMEKNLDIRHCTVQNVPHGVDDGLLTEKSSKSC